MSREKELRVLLDTSFILPTLGIDINDRVLKGLREIKDKRANILVSELSLLESLWIAIKLIKNNKFNKERFFLGIESVLSSDTYTLVSDQKESVYRRALDLYLLGHEDIIDNILYSIALEHKARFLTIDRELREFIKRNKLKDITIFPEELNKM